MSEKRLYLIDATAFCYRAFYALPGLATSSGQPTNAIYGFTVMLNKLLKEQHPEYLGVCFDVSRQTFRQKKFTEYKINRPPMPEGLTGQIPLIKQVVSAYGIPIFEKAGYEADDLIAAMNKKAGSEGFQVTIVSSDKDMLQLVGARTVVFSPYKDDGVVYDAQKVRERFGTGPEQITDILALMGDAVDNIPGVPGIGEKTAVGLIKQFGSLEKLLSGLDQVKQDKLRASLEECRDRVKLNKELTMLDADAAVDFDPDALKLAEPDYAALFKLFKTFEFKKLLKELPMEAVEGAPASTHLACVADEGLPDMCSSSREMVLYGQDAQDLAFHAGDAFFALKNLGTQAQRILADPRIKKVGHDLKKLKVRLARKDIMLAGLDFDVMIADYLVHSSRPGYGLGDIAWEHLGEVASGTAIESRRALELILKLKPKLEEQLRERSLTELFGDVEMPLVEVLAEMELNGICLDTKLLARLSAEVEERLGQLIQQIYGLSGCEFNINSPKQLREVLFEKLKLPVIKRTKTGPSTDEEVLHALAGRHALPALLLEYRQLMKLKNTYIDALPALVDPGTGRVHTCFNQTATETGRLSSTNPNLQNIPVKTDIGRKIRQAIIVSRPQDYLLACDYSQIELRVLAHFSEDPALIAAFEADKDIHKATAALIYGVEEKAVTDAMREVAKRVNFGISYGLTPFGLSRDLGIPVEQAGEFIDAYFLRYPGVKEYMQTQVARAEKDGFVTTISGRRRYLPDINNKNQAIRQFAQRQAINTPIQGSASDLIKMAMVRLHRQIKEKGLPARMILQIHDELVFDVAADSADECTELIRQGMETVLVLRVPIKVSIKKGKNWLEMAEVSPTRNLS
ncbi:MAG TPA: DNA polymerase I [Patescibacteria group bacterium]|nr:DNA polymerase I [Patescibacteria group bacterium]